MHLAPGMRILKADGQVAADGLQHGFPGLGHAPALLEAVQLAGGQLQHGLDVQQRPHGGHRGRDAPALPEVVKGLHGNVDHEIILAGFQRGLNLLRGTALVHQLDGIQNGAVLGRGYPTVVHHKHPSQVGLLLREHHGGLAGAAQPAAQGNVHHLLEVLKRRVPEGCHVSRCGLGGADFRPLPLPGKEHLPAQRHIFQPGLAVQHKGHGQNPHAQGLRCLRGDAAVAVGQDAKRLLHTASSQMPSLIS